MLDTSGPLKLNALDRVTADGVAIRVSTPNSGATGWADIWVLEEDLARWRDGLGVWGAAGLGLDQAVQQVLLGVVDPGGVPAGQLLPLRGGQQGQVGEPLVGVGGGGLQQGPVVPHQPRRRPPLEQLRAVLQIPFESLRTF
jgi:hypothetical protein